MYKTNERAELDVSFKRSTFHIELIYQNNDLMYFNKDQKANKNENLENKTHSRLKKF